MLEWNWENSRKESEEEKKFPFQFVSVYVSVVGTQSTEVNPLDGMSKYTQTHKL